MDSQDLRSFQVVAEELSFAAAARRLQVSAPSLTKRVQRLERVLGVALMEPTTTAVSLTAAGAWLTARASPLLDEWHSVADQIQLLAEQGPAVAARVSGVPVRLAVPVVGSGTLQSYLSAAMPAYDVTRMVMPAREAMERLGAEDGVDAVVIYDPGGAAPHPVAPGAHVATVVVEPVWVALAARHPLAERDELTVEEITEHGLPWIVNPPDHPIRSWEELILLGRAPQAQLLETSEMSALHIAGGRAVELASPGFPDTDLVAMRPLTPIVTVRLMLCWLPHRLAPAAAADLLTALRGYCRHLARQHPRYWRWILDHPNHFPGIAPDPSPGLPTAPSPTTGPGNGAQSLSVREREILALVATGLNDAEIARELQLSPHTAGTHVRNIRVKLGARDRVQLVVLAHQHGLTG